MKDLSLIVKRNTKALTNLLEDLKIDRTIEQLVKKADRIFIHDDNKTSMRLRLLSVERTGEFDVKEEFDKEGNFLQMTQKEKRKQVPLYTLKKKDYLEIEDSEKQHLFSKFDILIFLWKQLKLAYDLNESEKMSTYHVEMNKNILEEIGFFE